MLTHRYSAAAGRDLTAFFTWWNLPFHPAAVAARIPHSLAPWPGLDLDLQDLFMSGL
jgi:hypothetical protein